MGYLDLLILVRFLGLLFCDDCCYDCYGCRIVAALLSYYYLLAVCGSGLDCYGLFR